MYFGPGGEVSTLIALNGATSSYRRTIVSIGIPGPFHCRSWIIRVVHADPGELARSGATRASGVVEQSLRARGTCTVSVPADERVLGEPDALGQVVTADTDHDL